MVRRVDVAIVGAGSAGLAALAEVRKATDDFVVIDDGPLGTTCARAGCMPSKALIQLAGDYRRGRSLDGRGLRGGKGVRVDVPEALAWVRGLRDRFTEGPVLAAKRLGRRLVRERARFLGPHDLLAGASEYRARRVILATGSRPVVPKEFLDLGRKVVTTDELFDLPDLPARIGVVGLGAIGLELGQALSRLGRRVVAFDRARTLANLADPAVAAAAARLFAAEFPLRLGAGVEVRARAGGVEISSRGRVHRVDLLLASLGRRPNLDALGLEEIGVPFGENGLPRFDPRTLKIAGFPIYLAGDADADRPILHEALDDGRIAGLNSVRRAPLRGARRAPLSIAFCDPNIATVGESFAGLERGRFVAGECRFETEARALIMGENRGLLRVYAAKSGGRFLGAEMVGPAGEHLAHLMAWALQRRMTVRGMLEMPFYHPVVEEGLRAALRDAARKIG